MRGRENSSCEVVSDVSVCPNLLFYIGFLFLPASPICLIKRYIYVKRPSPTISGNAPATTPLDVHLSHDKIVN